jgi:hypothetical protein
VSRPKKRQHRRVKKSLPFLAVLVSTAALVLLSGCLATKVDNSGGGGAFTATNTNVNAIIDAAGTIFPQYGYSTGPVDYPNSISFDKPAGAFGKLMYGSYGVTTTMRAKLVITPLGGNNYRLSTRVARVSDAGEAGFEDTTKMVGLWSGEFNPLLRQIVAKASGAGPM